jgi:hypothetical protein
MGFCGRGLAPESGLSVTENVECAGLFGSKPPPTGISEPPEKSKKFEEVSICVY